jgi:hypothetical protein
MVPPATLPLKVNASEFPITISSTELRMLTESQSMAPSAACRELAAVPAGRPVSLLFQYEESVLPTTRRRLTLTSHSPLKSVTAAWAAPVRAACVGRRGGVNPVRHHLFLAGRHHVGLQADSGFRSPPPPLSPLTAMQGSELNKSLRPLARSCQTQRGPSGCCVRACSRLWLACVFPRSSP